MSDLTIYHNPRCSKSRETLKLLQDKGHEPNIVKYLDNPPSAKELKAILKKLGLTPRQLLRTREKDYKELGLKDEAKSDKDLIEAMIAHPKLIERPIVIKGQKARLGRPPEAVLEIL